MIKSRVSALSWILVLYAFLFPFAKCLAQDDRPNIIFFITDDMTRDMFNFLPESKGKNLTPAMDKLSGEGLIMMGQYVSSTVCTPSRFNCLTGMYASKSNSTEVLTAVKKNDGQRIIQWNTNIMPGEQNLAGLLREAGYYTGAVGKNHIYEVPGYVKVKLTDDFNDPEIKKTQISNYHKTKDAYYEAGFDFADGIYYENPDFNGPRELAVHNLDWTTSYALEFLDNAKLKKEPFFLYFATTLPHAPLEPDKSWNADRKITPTGYLDKPKNVLPLQESIPVRLQKSGKESNNKNCNLLMLDDALHALINKLENNGQLKNTIIIFFNDHGQFAKGTIYEGAVYNPSIIWKKGGFPAGSISYAKVSNVDFTPTILELAGVEKDHKEFDGTSFKKVLDGKSAETRESMYFEVGYTRGVRKGDYKYIALRYPEWVDKMDLKERKRILEEYNERLKIREKEPNNTDPAAPFGHVQIIPGGGDAEFPATKRYPFYADRDQMYDLSKDPGEQVNLANDPAYQKVLSEMKHELKQYIRDIPGNFGEFK